MKRLLRAGWCIGLLFAGRTWGAEATLEERLAALSNDQKIAQMHLVGLPEGPVSPETITLIQDRGIGGFVLRAGRNYLYPHELADLTRNLQRAAKEGRAGIPLLLAVEEGGLHGVFVPMFGGQNSPGPLALGSSGREEDAYAVYKAVGEELAACGVNMVIAPVLDVQVGSDASKQTVDTVGGIPAAAEAVGRGLVRGLAEAGVIAAPGTFPGVRNIAEDADNPWTFAEVPPPLATGPSTTAALVASHAPALLVSHVLLAPWDQTRPASLSPKIMARLHEEFAFQGLAISMALDGGESLALRSVETATVNAVTAGSDLVFQREADFAALEKRILSMAQALERGRITSARLDESVRRILAVKATYAREIRELPREDLYALLEREDIARACVQAAQNAVVVVRDTALMLPLRPEAKTVAVVCPTASVDPPGTAAPAVVLGPGLGSSLRKLHEQTRVAAVGCFPTDAESKRVAAAAGDADVIVVGLLFAQQSRAQQALVRQLLELKKPTVLVSLGAPGDLALFPEAETMIAANGPGQINCDAVARVLFGEARAGGVLPLPAGDEYPAGHALSGGG